ncbi:MAG TPA: hypothetical protein ENN19_18275, partial [Chloroflexi bacterium]|nr:hypothetical protein [Chloroflexota bacterium]
MDRKTIVRFVLSLALAFAALVVLFGLLGGADGRAAYAAESLLDVQPADQQTTSRSLPERTTLPETGRAPATASPRAPLMNGVEPSTVITVCSSGCDYALVQAAVSAAPEGALVKVAQGVYDPVELTKTLTLRGGYTTSNWLISRPDEHPTVLDGGGAAQVVRISDGDPTVEGFHIQNGAANEGAGVYIAGGEPVLRRNRIYGNAADGATGAGGGVHVAGGSPFLENNLIYTNTVDGQGGGLYLGGDGAAMVRYNTFYDNRSTGEGGGICVVSGSPVISASIIVSNTAPTGGGVYEEVTADAQVLRNNFFGNLNDNYVGGTLAGNNTFDPRFEGPIVGVDPAEMNFRLAPNSQCIGRDDPNYPDVYPDDDYDGFARPFGLWADIGAHEFYTGTCFARVSGGAVYTNVQAAVDAASAGGAVLVAGYCTGAGDNVVSVSKALTLRGGYTKTYWVESYPVAHRTVLDGEGARRVIYINQSGAASIESFDIYNGFVGNSGNGGGIRMAGSSSDLVIRHNRIYSNRVENHGGGVYVYGREPVLEGNEIYSNVASGWGGGIYVAPNVKNEVTIEGNWIYANVANNGGGIGINKQYVTDIATVRRNWIYSNTATNQGGGINVEVNNSRLEDNWIYANTAADNGGGVYLGSASNVLVIGNHIYNNNSDKSVNLANGGGGIFANRGVIRSNVITGNTAASYGGGIYAYNPETLVERNRVYGNEADQGGGVMLRNNATARNNLVYSNTSTLSGGGIRIRNGHVINNVIYDNAAPGGSGGGIYADGSSPGSYIYGNIVVSNTSGSSGTGINITGGNARLNNVWGNTCVGNCSDNLSEDPLFEDWVDFYLQPGSPCIDAITTTDKTYYADDDYDGYARPFGQYADMGAHEFYTGTCFARLSDGGRVYDVVQEAVVTATAGVSDVLVAGTCQGTAGLVTLDKPLGLYGGYAIEDWSAPVTETILDGAMITITAEGVSVGRFVIRNSASHAIYVDAIVSPTIQNVIGHDNAGGGFVSSQGGSPRLYHNTFAENTGDGIALSGAGYPVISNTIVVSNATGIVVSGGSSPYLAYNNVTGNSTNYSGVSAGASDVAFPPRFQNPAGGDFRLAFDSPCIHRADPNTGVALDFEGDARPAGDGYDIGADEAIDHLGLVFVDDEAGDTIPNRVVEYTHYLTNTGTRADSFVLNHTVDQPWDVDYVSVYTLAPGEGTAVPVALTVPSAVMSGTQATVHLTATSQSGVYFFDTVSNTTLVRSGWQFDLAPETGAQTADRGDTVVYTHVLTNLGATDSYTLTLDSSLGWATVIPDELNNVGSGAVEVIRIEIVVPSWAAGGSVEETILSVTSVGAASEDRVVQAAVTDTTDVTFDYGDRYVAPAVDGGDDHSGLNSCLAESDPCATIEQAVRRASDGETIKVAAGTYDEYNIPLNKAVVLQGGYTTSDWSTAAPDENPTVIDAGQNGRVLYIGGSPTVDGLILQNAESTGYGGGIYVAQGAEPTIRRTRITGNTASHGGGIYNAGGDFTLERCVVVGNSAGQFGGGVYNLSGDPDIFSSVFYDNVSGNSGGAFYNAGGAPRVWHDTFVYNETGNYGGGLFLGSGSSPVVSNTIIFSNTAGTNGGGVYNEAGSAVLAYNNAGDNVPNDYNSGAPHMSANPDFVDAQAGDFHLLKGSPCIDAGDGVDLAVIPEDLDGQPRWMNEWPDIGADEYQWARLELVSLNDQQKHTPTEVLTFTHILTNTGTDDDAFRLMWEQSLPGWTIAVDGVVTGPITTPVLIKDQAMPVDVVVTVPSGLLSGTTNLITLTATSLHDEEVSDFALNHATVERVVDVFLSPNLWFNETGWGNTTEEVVYTHTLANTGNYTDVFILSQWSSQATPGEDPWPVSVTPTPTVQLGMGESRVVSVTVTVPSYAQEIDVHRALVTATSQTAPYPYDVVTDTTVAEWAHGIAFGPPTSVGEGLPSETVEHTHYLTNTGNYTDTFGLTSTSDRGWPVSFSPSPTVTLGPSEIQEIKVQVEIPDRGVAFGGEWDTTLVTATSLSSRTLAAGATDVTTATHVPGATVYPDYDLLYSDQNPNPDVATGRDRVVRLVLTPTVTSDQDVVFTYTVRNNTTSNSTDTFTLTVSAGSVTPAQTGVMAWYEEITSYVTVTAHTPALLEPDYAPFTKTVISAQSWFSPETSGEALGILIINQWLGVELSPGQERFGPPTARAPGETTGSPIVYAHTITNSGNYTDSFALSSQVSQVNPQGWNVAFTGDAVNVVGGRPRTVDIGPKSSRVITVRVTTPYVLCGTRAVISVTAESRTLLDGTAGQYDTSTTTADEIVIEPVYYADMSPDLTLRYVSSSTNRLESYTRWLTNTGNCTNTFSLGAQGGFTPTLEPAQTAVLSSYLEGSNYSAPVAVTITVPGTDTGNLLFDTVVITADGDIGLGATDRVTRTDLVIINQQVDVSLVPSNTAVISEAGQVNVDWFTHTLTNRGNYTDTFDLTRTNEDGWQTTINPVEMTLPPGESQVVNVTVRVPADVYTVTNRTWVTATSRTPLAGTVMPYTPTATAMDTVEVRRPAVSVGPDAVRVAPHGETYTYTRMVENVGGLTDTYTITVSSERGWVTDWSPKAPDTTGALAPGLDHAIVVSLYVPYGTDYRITDTVMVTATAGISYTYVVSDVAVDTVQMEYNLQADLLPTHTVQVNPGDTVTRCHTLTNTGNYTETFTLLAIRNFVDIEELTPREVTLAPGEHVPVTVTIAVPLYAAGGESDEVEILVRKKDRDPGDPDPVTSVVNTLVVSYTDGVRHVAPTGSDVHNNCTMADGREPCRTVQHAVDQARHADTVKVAQGTYAAAPGATEVVRVGKSITLTGGYAVGDWENADPVARPTRLDAQEIEGRRVISIGAAITPTVQGFHLLRGHVEGDGAGLHISAGATPTVRLNRIYENVAAGDSHGGGIYYGGGGDPILARNVIYDNEARYGAGVYLESGMAHVWHNLLYRNVAEFFGGGLYNAEGDPLLWFNTIYDNSGGGVYI